MPRQLKAAAVQMDAAPAPTSERLERADYLIAAAARDGAQLVVLPELFNTGYEYSDANYTRAEPLDGQTATWMKRQAAKHRVHLAGTLLLIDREDVYNAALLVAPDGRTWRYDKNYPFLWERAYFREGRQITVAETDLGDFGLMICHDYNHTELWERYAGQVDALIVMSCPPRLHAFDLVFPDGLRVNTCDLGPLLSNLYICTPLARRRLMRISISTPPGCACLSFTPPVRVTFAPGCRLPRFRCSTCWPPAPICGNGCPRRTTCVLKPATISRRRSLMRLGR